MMVAFLIGLTVSIYNKIGISSKIFLTGDVVKCGIVNNRKIDFYVPSSNEELDDEDEKIEDKQFPENFH